MRAGIEVTRLPPKAFLSYSWESDVHRQWVLEFGTRLRADGVEVTLDQWHVQPGDQLPAFMEHAVRGNDYVLIVCTPHYAERSNQRRGGVGYEGDIMTAEVFTTRNERKFIPILRSGTWEKAAPSWLRGKYYVDLRGDPYSDEHYQDLLTTLLGLRHAAPPVAVRPDLTARSAGQQRAPSITSKANELEPIRILGVVVDEVTAPRNDGTTGSALYRIPFQLSRRPPHGWTEVFVHKWDRPSRWTTMHRPGIASVFGDKVYLDGTTMEEVEKYHRDTLMLAIEETNKLIANNEQKKRAEEERKRTQAEEHERSVREAANRIKFD